MTNAIAGTTTELTPLQTDALVARSQALGEPAWLTERRQQAAAAANDLPLPTPRERAWRYADLGRLDPGALALRFLRTPPGRAITVESGAPLARPLHQALGETEARQRLGLLVGHSDGKFEALAEAAWSDGVYVRIPRDRDLQEPVVIRYRPRLAGELAGFRHLIHVEQGARATVVLYLTSGATGESLLPALGEVFVDDGAQLDLYTVQELGGDAAWIAHNRVVLGGHARYRDLQVGIGGRLAKLWLDARLDGAFSHSEMLGSFFGSGRQQMDVITLQDHFGERSFSDLFYKSAVADQALAAYYGLVRINPSARMANANQEDRNLLLSDSARAEADPVLEILTSEVERCGHGASAGPVDPEQLFYLQSRGLPQRQATRLLVEGFLMQVFGRVPYEPLREHVGAAVTRKVQEQG